MNFIRIGCDKMGKTKYNPNSYYNDLFFPSKKKSVSYLYFDAKKAIIDRKNIENDNRNRPTIQQMLEVL